MVSSPYFHLHLGYTPDFSRGMKKRMFVKRKVFWKTVNTNTDKKRFPRLQQRPEKSKEVIESDMIGALSGKIDLSEKR